MYVDLKLRIQTVLKNTAQLDFYLANEGVLLVTWLGDEIEESRFEL